MFLLIKQVKKDNICYDKWLRMTDHLFFHQNKHDVVYIYRHCIAPKLAIMASLTHNYLKNVRRLSLYPSTLFLKNPDGILNSFICIEGFQASPSFAFCYKYWRHHFSRCRYTHKCGDILPASGCSPMYIFTTFSYYNSYGSMMKLETYFIHVPDILRGYNHWAFFLMCQKLSTLWTTQYS